MNKQKLLVVLFLLPLLVASFFSVGLASADTFGYDQIGASELSVKDYFRGSECYLNEDGVAYSITYALKSASNLTCNINMGIYDSDFNLVAETYQQNETLTSILSWYTYNLKTNTSLTAGTYYVVAWANSSLNEPTVSYNTGTTDAAVYCFSDFLGYGFPSVFTPEGYSARFIGAYVNYYVPEATPTPSPTPSPNDDMATSELWISILLVALVVINIVLFAVSFALVRFVFGVVSFALSAWSFVGYSGIPLAPYLQVMGLVVSVLAMLLATRARE